MFKYPKIIYFCNKVISDHDMFAANKWLILNPDHEIKLFDNHDCLQFLKDNFDPIYCDIFNFLKDGPIKADFWRVCILYKNGGIYSDIDIVPLLPINHWIETNIDFVTCSSYMIRRNFKFNPQLIICNKENLILKKCIDEYVLKYKNNNMYDYWDYSIMNVMNKVIDIDNYDYKWGIYTYENIKIQILKDKPGKHHYNAFCKYKNLRVLNNRSINWDNKNKCFKNIYNITNIFYQSWDESLPDEINNINKKYIPKNFEYKLYTMNNMVDYLQKNWGKKYVFLFNSYNKIAHKVDLWRYCILYETGGIYLDADCLLLDKIENIVSTCNMLFVTNNRKKEDIFNGFMMTFPKNPIFKEIIDYMLKTGNKFNDYYFNCRYLYKIINKYIRINLPNTHYNVMLNNVNYKLKLLIDEKINNVKIDNNWYEKSLYCAFNNNKCIMIESNKLYPYENKKKIIIGKSNNNTKTIKLKYIYPINTKLNFYHNYDDTFDYVFNENKLTITRKDKNTGWGQKLIGYIE